MLKAKQLFRKKKSAEESGKDLSVKEELPKAAAKSGFFGIIKCKIISLKEKIALVMAGKKKGSGPENPEKRIDFLKIQAKKIEDRRAAVQHRRQKLKSYLERAGIYTEPKNLSRKIFNTAIAINLILSGYLIYHFSTNFGITWGTVAASMAALWILVFMLLILALWTVYYFTLDLRIFKRKVMIEDVFPDYLQLTAANIKAGMTVDKALWYAVRPRFGVLAKEIEEVAKETMSGMDLKEALQKFSAKYDSMTLKRSISLIIEGLESGGEIGDLLNKISSNIQEQKIMFKEMSANVTTYSIFITFASIIAAPFLFALSGSLIGVIRGISGVLGGVNTAVAGSGLPLTFGSVGITPGDFKVFAIFSLVIGSSFSAMLVSTIKKGNIKSGVKYIPVFVAVSVSLYLIFQKLAGALLSLVF